MRGDLNKREARKAAKQFREARLSHPLSPIALMIAGYDDDPRELWDFPEVCRYVRWWARAAGLDDWQTASAVPWIVPSWGNAFLAACGVFGDDHPLILLATPPPTVT
jgi:hypothetical protein